MSAYLEAWKPAGREVVLLDGDRFTIGRSPSCDLALDGDQRVSRLHAALDRFGDGWSLRDLNSRNGTFVNGDPVAGERPLRSGDEIRVGETRLTYISRAAADLESVTEGADPPPDLTPRERDVLLALFRPAASPDVFTEPASTRDIAAALHVSDAAVKQHLQRLYDKFAIQAGDGERRRVRLANEALRRGAVTLAELRRT